MKTVLSTDWIEIHDHGDVYQAKFFLTDEREGYMFTVHNLWTDGGKKRFFKVNPDLMRGKNVMFEKIIESAEELPLERAVEIGLMRHVNF